MDLVKTGIGLTKTIRNVGRFREILNVFWRNGLDEFIVKTGLHTKIPGFILPKKRILESLKEGPDAKTFWESLGFRLRKSFEELGPSFIKVGQLLSTREDILDPALIKELKKLQDKAGKVSFNLSKEVLEKGLGKKIEDVFLSIDEEPIGMASIGMVYKAKLLNGDDVVVKVKRPNIESNIQTDFEIIAFMVAQAEKVSAEVRYMGVSRAINDFFKSIQLELNFLLEAQNCHTMKENLAKMEGSDIFVIPQIYDEYSTRDILVMELLKGRPFNTITDVKSEAPELENMLGVCIKIFTKTMLVDGFFHADLHGGNFFLLDNGKIGLIDFGLMGNLSRKNRTNLVAILFALVTSNYENLVYEFLDVAEYDVIPNHEALQRDIRDALAPFLGLSVQQTDVTEMTHSIVSTLSKHQIYLPREWFIIFRALMTLDGVGKSIQIDLNIFEVLDGQIKDVMQELLSKEAMLEDALWIGRDAINSARIIPRHIRWLLKEFARKKYVFDLSLKGFQKELTSVSSSIFFLALVILGSVFFFSGVHLLTNWGPQTQAGLVTWRDIPIIVWIIWSMAALSFGRAALFLRK